MLPRQYFKTAVGVGLAISAIAAPAASARPMFDPAQPVFNSPQHVVVDPSTGFATQVRPSPDRQTARADAGNPPILHRADSSKLAAVNQAKARALAYHVPPTARYGAADVNIYAASRPAVVKNPTLTAPGDGFDWGDAAIGAGVAAAIALLITGAGLAVRQRSQPRVP